MTKYALLSVSDKTDITTLAQALVDQGIKLLSTGGTYQIIKEAGIPVETVDSYTGFPEMMDGRVKTLHPKIHGGLLGLRDNPDHQQASLDHGIFPIDYVIVNLYPFKATIQKENVELAEAIENIDIGGPSMLRSAAKNYQSVTVVTDPKDYGFLLKELKEKGETSLEFRAYLAKKVFQLTSHYDALIASYLQKELGDLHNEDQQPWDHITLTYDNHEPLRYGENSHQAASFYKQVEAPQYSLAKAQQIHGKPLSYNNLRDADAAIKIAREFTQPVAVAVKHINPCGVAIGNNVEEAFERCFQADSVSIFGGIVVVNRPVSLKLAEALHKIFLEIIIAPSFDQDALELLTKKANLRLLCLEFAQKDQSYQDEIVGITGGILVQDPDQSQELFDRDLKQLPEAWEVMTDKEPSLNEIQAMNFAMKICKHVKSNAIVVTNDHMTLGIGAGQMNRVGSAEIALRQAEDNQSADKSVLVLASDAFFPFGDTVELAQKYGVNAVIQPGGSIRDNESVEVCNQNEMTMVKTNLRHFKH